jgi:hypothetical protein
MESEARRSRVRAAWCWPAGLRRTVPATNIGRCLRPTSKALAAEVYDWRAHFHDTESYWATGQDAADLLGVGRQRLQQLADADRVPFVRAHDGVRLYRRGQLETVANARDARWH